MARELGARLDLFHVISDTPIDRLRRLLAEAPADLEARVITDARGDVERLAELLREVYHIQAHADVASGELIAAINDRAAASHADLVVLGARGLGRFKEMVVGSVSHRVLHHSPCPVWIVHGPVPSLARVLLPLGGEEDAEPALRFFAKRPFPDSVEMHVLSVVPLSDPLWPLEAVKREALVQQQIEAAGRFAQATARRLGELGYRAVGATGLGWPAETILQEAVGRRADLVVMGSHSRKGVKRLLLGSVSHAVLHHAKTSVLLFH